MTDLGHLQRVSEKSIQPAIPSAGRFSSTRKQTYLALSAILMTAVTMTIMFKPFSPEPERNRKAIAMIPFLNPMGNKDEDYLCDGITDDILTQLYKIGDLKVTSRTTMQQYRETRKSVHELGDELNVGVLLEGSVRKSGNRIRIVAQLIDTCTHEHLWAETYDREMKDVFAVHSEIAQKIATVLQVNLSASERGRLLTPATFHVEAYTLILEGRYHLGRGTREDVAQAVEKFTQSVSIEPTNARAWAQLATCYARQADIGTLSTEDGYSKAREVAETRSRWMISSRRATLLWDGSRGRMIGTG